MSDAAIVWTQDAVADIPLRRFVGTIGGVVVGAVEYDGTNRLWTWSSPFQEDVWGHAQTEEGARQAFDAWLRAWLANFAPYLASR